MVKADIETNDGTKITVEGNAEEIQKILIAIKSNTSNTEEKETKIPKKKKRGATTRKKEGPSVISRIEKLKEKGFFSKPKGLSEVKNELEKEGHIYPITHLSGPLLRSVQKNILRRIKEANGWKYVNP
jgi:hypothetical protein